MVFAFFAGAKPGRRRISIPERPMPLFRRLHAKELILKYVGKRRRFHLARNEGSVRFAGTLLAVYRHDLEDEEHRFPDVTHVDILALFRTKRGRFLAYYVIDNHGNEHIAGKREYLKACETFEELEAFVGMMRYVNGSRFQDRIVAEARLAAFPETRQAEAVPPSAASSSPSEA
jgi:hypothetical protein